MILGYNSKAVNYIIYILGGVLSFFIYFIPARQFIGRLTVDSLGYIFHAATFTGLDWTGVYRNFNFYYSWGYSLLIALPFGMASSFESFYYLAILMNTLFACGMYIVAIFLIRKVAPELSVLVRTLVSITLVLYPAYMFRNTILLTETVLYFFVLLGILFVYLYIENEKLHWGILSGIAIGVTYLLHQRSIAVVIAYIITILALALVKKSYKMISIAIFPTVALLIINQLVISWLGIREMHGSAEMFNTYARQFSAMGGRLTFDGLISMMSIALGITWYIVIASFGLVGIGIYSVTKRLCYELKEGRASWIFNGFILLLTLGMFGLSILSSSSGELPNLYTRYDWIIYGRYFETTTGILLLLGLVEVCRFDLKLKERKDRKELFIIILLGAAFLSSIVYFLTRAFHGNLISHTHVVGVMTTFFEPAREFNVLYSSILGILLMTLLFFLLTRWKRVYIYCSLFILIGMFCFTGFNTIRTASNIAKERGVIGEMPLWNSDFAELKHYLYNHPTEMLMVYGDVVFQTSLQVMLPQQQMFGYTTGETLNDALSDALGGSMFVINKHTFPEFERKHILFENDTYVVMEIFSDRMSFLMHHLNIIEKTIKIPGLKSEYNFVFLADLHMSLADYRESHEIQEYAIERGYHFQSVRGVPSAKLLSYMVELANHLNVDAFLLGGDIIDIPSVLNLETLEYELGKLKMPYIMTIGNHDFTWEMAHLTEDTFTKLRPRLNPFVGELAEGGKVIEFEEFRIVTLDNSLHNIVTPNVLEVMSLLEDEKPLIIMLHIPLTTGMTYELVDYSIQVWGDRGTGASWVLVGDGGREPNESTRYLMEDILGEKSPVVAILAGHVHFSFTDMLTENIVQHTAPAGYRGEIILLTVSGD